MSMMYIAVCNECGWENIFFKNEDPTDELIVVCAHIFEENFLNIENWKFEMAAIAGDVKDLFAFKYKHRDDDFSDQYSRIFMTKAMLVATFITGMQWYSDDVSCTVPASLAGKCHFLRKGVLQRRLF